MNKNLFEFLQSHSSRMDQIIWDENMVRTESWGHTWEVADLKRVHSGRETATVYVYGRLTHSIDEKWGYKILTALEELQVKEESDRMYGGFRWYKEESYPIDSNAAFFIMAPLAIIRLFSPESLSKPETDLIETMLNRASHWFGEECLNPNLWYTNKIVSDGALLTSIGKITGQKKIIKASRLFLKKWLDYTENRGFGWGENLSIGYNGVTLKGFALIKKALDETEEDWQIRARFEKIEEGILDLFKFHDGHEFVPTIRSYNVEGKDRVSSILSNMAQVKDMGIRDVFQEETFYNFAIEFLLYDDRLYLDQRDYEKKGYSNNQKSPRIKETPIMDDKKAYSWLGKNGGLGSINKFPVIEGSYQHKSWGLGWQCFPVNMIVYDKQVSFLRFCVDDGTRMRFHPHKDKHKTYLDPALFAEHYYPEVKTNCKQSENTLVAVRSINKLRNRVRSISDSLDIQRFDGRLIEKRIEGRQWIILSYDMATIVISPLLGLSAMNGNDPIKTDSVNNSKTVKKGPDGAARMEIEIVREEKDISLVQWLYKGDLDTLYHDRISTAWLIHFIDESMNENQIEDYLKDFDICDSCRTDHEVPRQAQWYVHDIKIKRKDKPLIDFIYDPYK
jgi:hypothetical protein